VNDASSQPLATLLTRLRDNSALVTMVLITLAIGLGDLFYLTQSYHDGRKLALEQSEEALHAFEYLLQDKGQVFAVRDGQLLVDDYVLSGNTEVTDRVRDIFSVTATLFLDRVRVATSAADEQGNRLIGTYMDEKVARVIFDQDRSYQGTAEVFGQPHFTAYKPLHDADGKVIGAMAVGIDQERFHASFAKLRQDLFTGSVLIEVFLLVLTFLYFRERKWHEWQRQKGSERYRTLFEVAAEGIFLLGNNDTIIDCNPAAVRMFGGSREDLIGATPFDVSPAYQPDGRVSLEVGSPTLEAVWAGESKAFNWQHRRFNGELFDAEVLLKPLDDPSGPLVQCTIRDVTERQQAQRQLEASEQRYRALFEMNGVATVLCAADGRLLLANREFFHLSQHSVAALESGLQIEALFDPSCHEQLHGLLAQLRQQPQHFSATLDCDLLRSSGEVRHITMYLAGIPGSDRCFVTLHDVTLLKNLGLSLQSQLQFLQTLIDTIPNPVFYKDRAGRYLGCNRSFEQQIGVRREELVGKSVYDLAPDELARIYAAKDEELFTHPGTQIYESQNQPLHGDRREVIYYKATFNDEAGRVAGLVGVMLDITEQKRVEATLRESEERFHQLFSQHHDAMFLLQADNSDFIDVNESALRLFGYDREAMLATSPATLLAPGVFARLVAEVRNSGDGDGFRFDDIQARRADGEFFPASLWGKTVTLRDTRVIFCSVRDLTEKVHLEEAMRATQAKLIHANKMTSLGLLTSSVGHEINNPNSYIGVNATLLADAWQDALPVLQKYQEAYGDFALGGLPFSEMKELVPRLCAGIIDGSQRISNIVKELKSFVREEKWGSRAEVAVNDVVQAATSILWHHIHRYTDHFHLELGEDLPIVRGSLQQLEQVVVNLVMNALQALPDKSRSVTVRTMANPEGAAIVVTDQGCGMAAQVLEKVAEPFFTTRIDEGGTGLGLYISTSVLAEHGGRMEFASRPEEGTTVTVTLPAAAAADTVS